jgi:hypothetical protein
MECMAQLYIDNVDEKVAVVTSHDGLVQRVITPASGFPYLGLRRGGPLPARALARMFLPGGGGQTSDFARCSQTAGWKIAGPRRRSMSR